VLAVVAAIAGMYGLLRPWAWSLGLAVQALGALQVLLRWATGRAGLLEAVLLLGLSAVVAWYLFRADVLAAFGRQVRPR
jgi:hypothetical protein